MAGTTYGFNLPILNQVSFTSGPVVSVSKFGAVGDGKTNDTAAIQSALNYIKVNGGTLNFEAGRTYIVSRSVTITGADDFKIDGNGATIKMANGAPVDSAHSILRIEASDHFAVAELTLDGNRANRSPGQEVPAHNVLIKDSHDFSFSDVTAINAVNDGFNLRGTDRADRSTYVQNALFLNCRADDSFRNGMTIGNGENVQVIGGAYTSAHGTRPAAGIDVEAEGVSASGNHNILIRGVTLSGNDGFGVQLSPKALSSNITVEGSYLTDNDRGAIRLGSLRTLIQGNTFEDSSQSERGLIDLPAARTNSNNVITGNSFNHISTGQAVVFAHRDSGTNNQVYGNKYYDIDGPFLQSYTTGTTGWNNVLTKSATDPTTLSEPTLSTTSDPAPTTSGGVINGTSGDHQFVATANAETFSGYGGTDGISYVNSSSAVTVKLWNGTGVGGHAEGDTFVSIESAIGSNYHDRLEGTDANNQLAGAGGDDSLLGFGGDDLISGGSGLDQLYGGSGNDTIRGGDGHDAISGDAGLDNLYGGSGNDTISGNGDADKLYGEAGNDVLDGGVGADTLVGGPGADTLQGGDGKDLLLGGEGNDRLIGGAGADNYVFDKPLSGNDVIVGFDVTADHVVLSANLNSNGINTAAQAVAHVHAGPNGNAVLDLGGGNTVTFQGVTPAQLHTEDFVVT